MKFLDSKDACIDTTLFDQRTYREIQNNGLSVSPAKIIHHAAVHYSGRYRDSISMRLINSLTDLYVSFSDNPGNGLYLSDDESSEFQTRSSEVLAVGLCIGFTTEIFSIKSNRIYTIEQSGKRCDFAFLKDEKEYFIESKGRKYDVSTAIGDILNKKLTVDPFAPKYGVVSHLPRECSRVSMTIVDPEFIPKEISVADEIKQLLSHYSRVVFLCGFWRLGELLNDRIEELSNGRDYRELDNVPLEFGNVRKLGISVTIAEQGGSAFFQRNGDSSFQPRVGRYFSIFLIKDEVLNLLQSQDFSKLMAYSNEETNTVHEDLSAYSLLDDGSIFGLIHEDYLKSII